MTQANDIANPAKSPPRGGAKDARRRAVLQKLGDYRPAERKRTVSKALQAYAAMTTSAAKGAVRDVGQLDR